MAAEVITSKEVFVKEVEEQWRRLGEEVDQEELKRGCGERWGKTSETERKWFENSLAPDPVVKTGMSINIKEEDVVGAMPSEEEDRVWKRKAEDIASNLPPILGGCPLIGGFWLKSINLPPICPLFF